MNEKTKKELIQQLIIDEGIELKPYECPAGYLTIGIGRNLETNGLSEHEIYSLIIGNPQRNERIQFTPSTPKSETWKELLNDFQRHGITREEAIWLCENDVAVCYRQLQNRLLWYKGAPDELKSILINMCFNMGIGTLMTFKNTLKYMEAGQYEKASENMLKSKWARQVKKRAKRLAERVKNLQS